MFLKHFRLKRRASANDEGAALVMVVALVAVAAIVSLAVSSSYLSANGVTTLTRAGVQSEASAQAGIDYVLGELNVKNFLCTADKKNQDPAFTVAVSYKDAGGSALSCGTVVSGTPATASILSTGYARNGGSTTAIANTQQMGATVTITLPSVGAVLDRALFTENDFTLTNNSTVNQSAGGASDGDVYTNGGLDCLTQNVIQGVIVARGAIDIANPCQVLESVWTGGDFTMASSANIGGDVYAVGSASLDAGHVGGSVIANGSASTTSGSGIACPAGGSANVCGSVYSLNGGVQLQNESVIAGNIYARNDITLGGNGTSPQGNLVSLKGTLSMNNSAVGGTSRVYGAISGNKIVSSRTCSVTSKSSSYSVCSGALVLPLSSGAQASFAPAGSANLGTTTSTVLVAAPPRQAFPQIASSATAISQSWGSWTKKVVPANDPLCSSSNSSFTTAFAPTLAAQTSGSKLLVQFQCTSPVSLGNDTLSLKGDVAFMTPYGFNSQNNFTVKSSDSKPHSVYLIVPSDAPGVTWSAADSAYPGQLKPVCSPSRDIAINTLTVENANQMFLYSPCSVSIQNAPASAFSGQIYAGSASYPAGIRITRALMAVPGVTIPGTTAPSGAPTITLNSRYDIG